MRAVLLAVALIAVASCGRQHPVAPFAGSTSGRFLQGYPVQSLESRGPRFSAEIATSAPHLVLSVKTLNRPRAVASDWVIVATYAIRNPGTQPVVLGEGLGCFIQLALENSEGQRVAEYCFGYLPVTLDPKETLTSTIELPAPHDPGVYSLTLSISGRPESSPPCVVRVIAHQGVMGAHHLERIVELN